MPMIFLFLFTILSVLGQDNVDKASGGDDLLDFSSIKEVIESDRLKKEVKKKQSQKKEQKKVQKVIDKKKYYVPNRDVFWSFFSEYYLVKNVTVLKWDFQKPDYGLEKSFKIFLEKFGFFEIKFKILLLNTPEISHFALPSNRNEFIFLLSVPFIRSLDLSKLEISLILFEDMIRARNGYFKRYVQTPEINKLMGLNFQGRKLDLKVFKEVSKRYDEILFEKGFTFKQQFQVTKEMSMMLKDQPKLWNGYYLMLQKIDGLVKTNAFYRKYLNIYPSPELQMSWLNPKKPRSL